MTWFKIDDQFADHPKLVALQEHDGWKGALALWTLAGSWSARQLTDGHVPRAVVRRLGCELPEAEVLVAAGLWLTAEGGYQFHDWTDYNPTRSQTLEKREKNKQKQANFRNRKRNQVTPPVTPSVSAPVSHPPPDPTRPDPSRPVPNQPESPPPEEGIPETRCGGDGAAEVAPSEPPSRGKPRLPVSEVFEYWKSRTGKTAAAKLDSKRKRRIEWALKAYGLDAVRTCIDGYAASDWHMGRNDRGQRYDDLTLWLRDAEKVERGISMALEGPGVMRRGALPPANIDPEASRKSIEAARELFGPLPGESRRPGYRGGRLPPGTGKGFPTDDITSSPEQPRGWEF